MTQRSLTPGTDSSLHLPRTTGLNIANWASETNPSLNGRAIRLEQYETSRSLALTPDASSSQGGFALGANWSLRFFSSSGQQRWAKQVPDVTWGVNVSPDGRLVVAAYGDGTIRWHRVSDGQELLAFFPHADRKRWVLWTPSGYFDASPGGEDLIGWHINRGSDAAADFFPASRFRSQFYRPDVIDRVLDAGSEADVLAQANQDAGRKDTPTVSVVQVLPPVVEILAPVGDSTVGSTSVTLRYRVRSDTPVTGLRARVNGQAVQTRNASALEGDATQERSVTVSIPEQDSEIQLFADNKNGTSTPATLRLRWAGKPAPAPEISNKPKLYLLAVGVSQYANPQYNLDLAAKDATDMARVLQAQKGKLYADVQVRLLTNAKATKDDVLDGLEWLKKEVTAKDVGIMFLAGHGMNDNTGKYYFLPHNADPGKLLRTGVAQTDIRDTLNTLAGKVVFFIDTCHSGNALGTARTRAATAPVDAFVNELASAENGVLVFTAATGRQLSLEDNSWGNGAFTKAVVEGLSGKADQQNTGRVTHKALDYYVSERVKQLTGGQQSPTSIIPQGVQDFPLAVVK